jgi:HlyD family secretion protein
MRAWSIWVFRLVVLLVLLSSVGYAYFAAVPVVEHRLETGSLIAEVMGTGTLEARLKSTISPKIAGRVREILVDQGDQVEAGQLLFTLGDRTLADRRGGLSRSVAAQLEGRKQITTAEKSLAYSEARLADTQVVAPFDGLIVKRYRDPGDIGVPGSPILMLVSTQEIWVSAWVDETEMSRLHPNQSARVVFRSEAGKNYQGKVSRLGREADRETREFVVDVRVVTLPENWAVGQRAEVYVEVDRKSDVPLVPTKFVFWHGNTPGVFCRVGDRARWREITLGLRGAETVEVD